MISISAVLRAAGSIFASTLDVAYDERGYVDASIIPPEWAFTRFVRAVRDPYRCAIHRGPSSLQSRAN